MKRLLAFGVILLAGLLNGCGSDNSLADGPNDQGAGAAAAIIELLTSSPQLQSDQTGSTKVTLTAIAKDATNNVVEGAVVGFNATSGSIQITQGTTDANGVALATLSNGNDASNRTITVTATTGSATASIDVAVVGTTLTISGPVSLGISDSGVYTILLEDSNGTGVPNQAVTVTSANGNTLSAPSLQTDTNSEVEVTLTADVGGDDTLTAMAGGLTATRVVSIAPDAFVITTPLEGAEIDLGVAQDIIANWTVSGAPQVGQTITFTSTRGTLSAGTADTDGAGDSTVPAPVSVTSTNAGPGVITATTPTGISATLNVEFVATTVDNVSVQASPTNVGTGLQSDIDAVVRDAAGNLVKNQIVNFELTDFTGGFLSVASAITDSQGSARTIYTGGSVASAVDGVAIRAYVGDPVTPAAENTVLLTVAQQTLFLQIGTGNDLFEPTTASFAKEWNIFVSDPLGNAVANAPVQVSVLSEEYRKGFLSIILGPPIQWAYDPGGTPVECLDEDVNRNGILDPGEDANGSLVIEAGNVATVAAVPVSAPGNDNCASAGAAGTSATATTNGLGIARVCVIYPQNFGLWLVANIEARASVQGTEGSTSQSFLLDAKADDLTTTTSSPPGQTSPFGGDTVLDCNPVP